MKHTRARILKTTFRMCYVIILMFFTCVARSGEQIHVPSGQIVISNNDEKQFDEDKPNGNTVVTETMPTLGAGVCRVFILLVPLDDKPINALGPTAAVTLSSFALLGDNRLPYRKFSMAVDPKTGELSTVIDVPIVSDRLRLSLTPIHLKAKSYRLFFSAYFPRVE